MPHILFAQARLSTKGLEFIDAICNVESLRSLLMLFINLDEKTCLH